MMSKIQPLVSICCITYNHEHYINQCIDGFLMQKTTFPFEILIHDDASTDNTANIIREYETKYPDIIKPIYQTENQYSKGVKVSNKYNYSRAKGKYIAVCEGDDYWTDPFKLKHQVDYLEGNTDYTLCFSNSLVIYEHGEFKQHLFNNLNTSREIGIKEIITNWIIPTASIVFRKDILPLPEWSNQIYSGDMTIALTAISKGKIYYMNKTMSVYRKSLFGTSLSSKTLTNYEFVLGQHIKLYQLFGKENHKYEDIINHKISYLNNELRFQRLKNKNIIFALILMPIFSLKKFLNKIEKKCK